MRKFYLEIKIKFTRITEHFLKKMTGIDNWFFIFMIIVKYNYWESEQVIISYQYYLLILRRNRY